MLLFKYCYIGRYYPKSDGTFACGFLLEFGLPWNQANKRCQDMGGRLPEIKNKQENEEIRNIKAMKTNLEIQFK